MQHKEPQRQEARSSSHIVAEETRSVLSKCLSCCCCLACVAGEANLRMSETDLSAQRAKKEKQGKSVGGGSKGPFDLEQYWTHMECSFTHPESVNTSRLRLGSKGIF